VLLRQLGHEQDARAALEKGADPAPSAAPRGAGVSCPPPRPRPPCPAGDAQSFMEGSSALPVSVSYTGSEGRMIGGLQPRAGGRRAGPRAPPAPRPPPAAGAGEPGNPSGRPQPGGTVLARPHGRLGRQHQQEGLGLDLPPAAGRPGGQGGAGRGAPRTCCWTDPGPERPSCLNVRR